MEREAIRRGLLAEMADLTVLDTHEHLPFYESVRLESKQDVLGEYLTHYLRSDIVSAGLGKKDLDIVVDPARDLMERWAIVEPYWENARYTGYGRALDLAVRGIYGIDGVRRETLQQLNEAFVQAKAIGHYERVLGGLCHIETCLVDCYTFRLAEPAQRFRFIWQPLEFIRPYGADATKLLEELGERHGLQVKSLSDWEDALEKEMDDRIALHGGRVLKLAIAYRRSLRFEKVEQARAAALFDQALEDVKSLIFPTELQDYMMHAVLRLANARQLTVQFHTGLLEGNGNTLSHSDPGLLNNLFLEYPDVRFDLFHIGYPYQGVVCALAKMFPNVYVDMCWAHIISPSACVAALSDFLDAVPWNKISAFGGDYCFPDGVYGHLLMSKETVSRVLAEKVADRVFGADKALTIAKALYYDNPKRIFQLEGR